MRPFCRLHFSGKEKLMTSPLGIRILYIFITLLLLIVASSQALTAQEGQHKPSLAVLRLKSSEETQERRLLVKDLSANLAAALRQEKILDVCDDARVRAAIEDEGLRPNGLLKPGDCLQVGKNLSVEYVVVGGAILERQKWHASVRVLSVPAGALVTTVEAEYPVSEINTLYSVLASRISSALSEPKRPSPSPDRFAWSKDYLVSFGKQRIDLEPPILLALSTNPPFEMSIVADMAPVSGSGFAVTNFEIFIDDRSLGSIHPQLKPPIPVQERTWTLAGRAYRFNLDLKEIRILDLSRTGEDEALFITSALISVRVESVTREE
jgi:TolB-like protein